MKKAALLVLILFSAVRASADTPSGFFPYQEETDEIVFIDKKTGEQRSVLTYTLKKTLSQGETVLDFYRTGKGKCDKYRDITWETTARLKEKNGFLYVLNSSCTAKDPQAKIILRYEKRFDYAQKLIYWRQLDADGNITKEVRFPIKGKTADDTTLIYFLRAYVANRNDPDYRSYYFLSNEPKLYKVNIKVMGHETPDLSIGTGKAVKLKLTGDMGIIDDILDKYVPHTYVWYEDAPPYAWLQYEGLETSMQSANVTAYVTKRSRQ